MKKYRLLICLFIAITLLTGCKNKKESEKNDDKNLSGGWEVATNVKYVKGMNKEAKEVFDKAIENYTGLTLEPYALLGTQVVSGTNYMYLAMGTTVSQNPVSNWKIVVIYKDLNNKVEITKVSDFDFTKYTNNDIQFESKENVGGWTINIDEIETTTDKEIEDVYNKATDNYTGVKLNKISYLGNQLVSGTNYAFIDVATTMTSNPENYIAVVTVYKDLEGNTDISSVSYVDLANFN